MIEPHTAKRFDSPFAPRELLISALEAETIPTPVAIIIKYKGKDLAIVANAFADILPAKVSTIL